MSFLITVTKVGGYNIPLMMAVLHLLTAVWGYVLITQLTADELPGILRWMARLAVALSVYGICQHLNFDQFFTSLVDHGVHDAVLQNRRVLGTIGNPSHFAAYLSCAWPILLAQKGPQWWLGRGVLLLAVIWTFSWGGVLAILLISLWWIRRHRMVLWALVGLTSLGLGVLWLVNAEYFSLSGRWERWGLFLSLFRKTIVTGAGPGALMNLSQGITDPNHPLYHWRHAHNEYLQVLIEEGVVGLALIGWMLSDWAKKAWVMRDDHTAATLLAVLAAFLCNSLYNFPAHLWIMGSIGLFAYGGMYVLWAEDS